MDIELYEHKLQIATAEDVNTNGSFGYAVDVDGDYAVVTKRGHQENFNSAYIFKKTGNNWAMHQDISGQPIGYDNFGLDAKIRNELVFISCRTYYSDASQRASNEKGGIHVYKLNSTTGFFEPYNPANLDPTDKAKYGYDNAGNYNNEWGPYNFPAGPDARSNVIVSGPNYDGTDPEDFYFDAIPLNPNAEFSYFFDVYYENDVYTLIVGHPGTYDFYVFRHNINEASKGWLRWRYVLGSPNQQKTGYDDVAIYGDYIFLSYTDPISTEEKKGKIYIYKFDNTQSNFADKWQRQTTDLMASTRTADERFGTSLSAFEDYLIVGTENEKAYIYKKDNNGEWLNSSEIILTAKTPESNSKFGIEVAIGKINPEYYAVVGARQKTVNGQTNEGAFYLFKLIDGAWVQRDDTEDGEFIQASGDNPAATFSASIDIRNNQIIVGADGHQNNTTADNSTTTYSGAAYIFNLEDNTPSTYNVGLTDISNNFLISTSTVKIADVDTYFQETINIKNFETSELNTLFTDLSNNEFTKSVKNYIGFKMIKIKSSLAETITLALYESNDTANSTFDIEDIVSVAKEVIFDASNNENINDGIVTPSSETKSLYRELKTLALRKLRSNVDEDTFETAIKNISETDNDDNIQTYLENIDKNLALNLSNMDLCGVDLTGIDLSGAILEGTDLSGANLTGANLTGADLSGSVLDNVNLSNTIAKNIKNINTSTGITDKYPYNFQIFNNQMRTLTEDLNKGSISTKETKIGPFKQGQTIIVNGVKIILGESVSDAVLVDSNPDSLGDTFTIIEKDNNIKNWGHKNRGGNIPYDISNVKIISKNEHATAILTIDGFVYAWGNNNYGGNLTQDLSGITDLFANEKAFCALKNNGKIFCWGDSSTGGTTPTNIQNVITVYSNKNAFTALLSDGTIRTWGSVNGNVPTSNNFIDVFSTLDCFCGLKGDGTIESWGSSNNSLNAVPVDISNVSIVYSNDNAFVALTGDGYLYNWGDSSYGGTTDLSGLSNIEKVFNNNFAFASIDQDKNLFCWGNSNKGGTAPDSSDNIVNVFSTQDAFTGIKQDKSIVCWGNINNGGDEPIENNTVRDVPTCLINTIGCAIYRKDKTVVTFGKKDIFTPIIKKTVHELTNVRQIYNNAQAFCALLENGTVYVWGETNWGGENTDEVKLLKNIIDIFPVYTGFVAIDKNNKLFSWGTNYLDQTPPANSEKIKYLVRNKFVTTVITENNTLKEWGHSSAKHGTEIPNVKKFWPGYQVNGVIKEDNSVIIYGSGGWHDETELGVSDRGVRGPSSSTVDETLIQTNDISNVLITSDSGCILKFDGSVYTWGYPQYGGNMHDSTYGARGGDSSTVNPSLLSSGVKNIYIQRAYSSARGFIAHKTDGSLVCWGNTYMNPHNTSHGVRKATFYNDSAIYPEEITSGIEKVFFSFHAQAAIKTDGSVITWGHSSYGGNICSSGSGVRDLNSATVNPSVLGPNCGVKNIIHNQHSFLALKEDGSIHSVWGHASYSGNFHHSTYGARRGDSTSVNVEALKGKVKQIVRGKSVYCVIMENGDLITWGQKVYGGDMHDSTWGTKAVCGVDPKTIYEIGAKFAFAAPTSFLIILNDNSIVALGHYGNNTEHLDQFNFDNEKHLLFNLDINKKVLFEYHSLPDQNEATYYLQNREFYVQDISNNSVNTVNSKLNNIERVFSTDKSFAAINKNGELKIWGNGNYGGSYDNLGDKNRVVDVMSTKGAFIGINQDGTHFIWGNNNFGGFGGPSQSFKFENRLQDLYSYCQSYRKSNLFALYGINKDTRKIAEESFTDTNSAHIALSNDGSVSTWGNETLGASSTNTQNTIDNLTNVKDISTGNDTVVALKSDGTLTAWNNDDITIADNSNFKKVVTGISGNIIGLKADGTVKYYNPGLDNWTLESNIDTSHVTDLSGITDVFAFDKSFAALDDKGALTVWGDKAQGPDFTKIKDFSSNDIAAGDKFGGDVSIYGDYIVVGARSDNSNKGAAYVFKKDEGGTNNWGQIKKLTASNADDNDYFGGRVSINDNYIAVAATYDDDVDTNTGAVYIFKKDQGGTDNWGEIKKIVSDDANANNYRFGRRVVFDGDYLVVGADHFHSGGKADSGAVYIYKKDKDGTDNWGQIKKLIPSNPTAWKYMGYYIGINDGYIAASSYNGVYVFEQNEGGPDNWGEVKNITNSSVTDFGNNCDLYGDYIVVGNLYCNHADITNSGCVYIYKKNYDPLTPNDISANAWGQIKTIAAANPVVNGWFGKSVKINNNFIFCYASKSNDTDGSSSGAIYVFKKNGDDNWEQISILKLSNPVSQDSFGSHGSININSSNNNVIIGAQGRDDNGTDSGGAYLYEYDAGDGPNLLTNISSKASQLTSGVKSVTANSNVLIALKYDGTVVTLGNANNGGDISNTADQYKLYGGTADDIEEVFLNDKFAVALKRDRTCIYWGDISRNTDLFNSDISKFKNIKTVVFSKDVMIGLTFDGKIYTLGEKSKGGDYPFQLEKNVDKVIAASLNGFLAVTNDSKIYSWGEDSDYSNNIDNAFRTIEPSSSGSSGSSGSSSSSGSSGSSSSSGNTDSSSTNDTSSGDTSSGGTSSGDTSSGGGGYYY